MLTQNETFKKTSFIHFPHLVFIRHSCKNHRYVSYYHKNMFILQDKIPETI